MGSKNLPSPFAIESRNHKGVTYSFIRHCCSEDRRERLSYWHATDYCCYEGEAQDQFLQAPSLYDCEDETPVEVLVLIVGSIQLDRGRAIQSFVSNVCQIR